MATQKSRNSNGNKQNNKKTTNRPSLEAVRLALLLHLRRRRPGVAASVTVAAIAAVAAAAASRPPPTFPRIRMLASTIRSRLEILTLPDLRTILMQLINEKRGDTKFFNDPLARSTSHYGANVPNCWSKSKA